MNFHLTPNSANAKTGPIAVSTSSKASCPDCVFKGNGCYAESGPLAIHWREVSNGNRGVDFDTFINQVKSLPRGHKLRVSQAGDLPGYGNIINPLQLRKLTGAIKERKLIAWAYTHKPMTPSNLVAVREANAAGFRINASANTLAQADEYRALGLPTVVVLPSDTKENVITPAGNKVVICPVMTGRADSCGSCLLCHKNRSAIVGFPAHSSAKKKVDAIISGYGSK